MSKTCKECGGQMDLSKTCGAYVCHECGDHEGLERCFCGFSRTDPGRGREELEEMGETIDEE